MFRINFETSIVMKENLTICLTTNIDGQPLFTQEFDELCSLDSLDVSMVEKFMGDFLLVLHKKGFQRLSAWLEKEFEQMDYEDNTTFKYAFLCFLQELNLHSFNEDPVY